MARLICPQIVVIDLSVMAFRLAISAFKEEVDIEKRNRQANIRFQQIIGNLHKYVPDRCRW